MRQKGDVEFGQIVSRLRIGEMTDDDIRVLASRFITVIKGTGIVTCRRGKVK